MVEDRGPRLRNICAVFLACAVFSTAVRCYTRARLVKWFGLDDWLMVAAAVSLTIIFELIRASTDGIEQLCYIMFSTCVIAGVHYGTGRHFSDLEPEDSMKALRYWWLCYLAYSLTMIFAKTSIGFFLLRVAVARIQRQVIYSVVCTTVVVGIVFLFVTVFECSPVSYFWNRAQDGHCLSMDVIIGLTYFYSVVNAICDFTFGLLPVFLVWKLQMDRRVKIILIPILGMGCVAAIAVLVRMAYVRDFADPDFLWATVNIAVWSDIELGLAITAGSLACLRPLVHIVNAKLGLSSVKTPRPNPDYISAGRKTPNISGPFNLASFNKDDKWRLSSGANDEAFRPTYLDENGNKDQWVTGQSVNGSEEHLRSTPKVEMQHPPKAYAKSESVGGVGRYVHK
ncbi:uncharacterized protein A1O9_05893 [Exophiala aquamarina CBS 119918]|uniref:Rhodopsin domain-containing protein n=1 Tax=Exophiala aquamarina CBS 119918 TaxID=1182545 RepID=A0A072PR11_9EURO|nr:uncharacterized protein A1O9_05893 [Exophiala aquamarina CBS 119918]KEF57970.1 hypothetical protein A1O9_05893 [Exophiala aquamarina CBS 119918]